MSNNKNIKLPQHLQLDSVSPATRLLEKRRLMYEVQKAFDDQKLEFAAKDKKFKLQETELREKDILIQDNLIKFSTFLQQQETKKFKDTEAAGQEKIRIEKLDADIAEQQIKLQIAQEKSKQIESRVNQMKRYEQFLETVKEANPEEFEDLISILSRYKTLQSRNEGLKINQKEMIEQHDQIQLDCAELDSLLQSKKMEMSNLQAKRQEDQHRVDQEKGTLKQEQDEAAKAKASMITQTGQMLMTIKNLYEKCEQMKMIFPSLQGYNMEKYDHISNFNNTGKSGEKALVQLQVIYKCLKNFTDLKREYQQTRKEVNVGNDPAHRERKYMKY